jgi:hypothetical protein
MLLRGIMTLLDGTFVDYPENFYNEKAVETFES